MRSERTTPFARRVYELVGQVPPGRVVTYGLVARLLGDPHAARQVGWAMAAAARHAPPIPAHRVINARGELSGAAAFGGYARLRAQLEAEGVEFMDDGRVDLDACLWLPDENGPNENGPSGQRGRRPRSKTQR